MPMGAPTTMAPSSSSINPVSQRQLPFLSAGWNKAANLLNTDPMRYFPGQTMALPNPFEYGGFQGLMGAGQNAANMLGGLNGAYGNAIGGGFGVGNSPVFGNLMGIANGQYGVQNSPAFAGLMGLARGGAGVQNSPEFAALRQMANGGGSPAMDQLTRTANGAYLNKNPYVNGMFNAASDAVTRAYQTATAPQTDSEMEAAGRYGSGALTNAQSQNQQDLGTSLGNLASNIYGQNYENERNLMVNAAGTGAGLQQGAMGQLGNLYTAGNQLKLGANQALEGGYEAGNQLGLGANNTLQSGFQGGNALTLGALGMGPSMLGAQGIPAGFEEQGGQGLQGLKQSIINNNMARFYGNQSAPWQTLQSYLGAIGQPTFGGSINSQAYSPFAQGLGNIMGGIGGINALSGALGGGGGIPGMIGSLPSATESAAGGDFSSGSGLLAALPALGKAMA